MIFTLFLFAENNKKFAVGFSVNSVLINNSNYGYFSKDNLATEISADFLYKIMKDISIGINFENMIDQSNENSFDYMTANLVVNYDYNLVGSLDLFASLSGGYQKSYFTLSEENFTSNDINITPSLGIKYSFNVNKTNFDISYELGYKHQTDVDLKFKIYSRDINYGNFSASGMKQKIKVSVLF
jgi:hypothetical protein